MTPLDEVLARSHELGFLGPQPAALQLEHARAFLTELPDSGRVLDLGSGGGVPGLVLLVDRPDLTWTLLDANERRGAFLRWAVRQLGADAEVRITRAEVAGSAAGTRGTFDAVVARSFGPPPATAELGGALLRLGGRLIVSEPPDERDDRWPADGLAALGFDAGTLLRTGVATIRRFNRVGDYPHGLPRDERRIRRQPWPRST